MAVSLPWQPTPFKSQSQSRGSQASSSSGGSEPISFVPQKITVIPHISTALPILVAPDQPVDVNNTMPAVDLTMPPGDFGGEFGGDFGEPVEDFTEEDCHDLSEMIWGAPAMLLGEHLTPDPGRLNKFGKELYKYCSKKGINPTDYFFDELPLIMVGGTMGLTMWRAHKDFKGDKVYDAPETPEREKRHLGKPTKTGNDDGIIQGEVTKYTDDDKRVKTETTEYKPNMEPHEVVPENEFGEDSLELSRL